MRVTVWLFLMGFCAVSIRAQDFPCKLTDYRIVDSRTLGVLCDAVVVAPSAFSVTGSLFLIQDENIVRPAIQRNVTGSIAVETWWLSFKFGKPLEGGKDYELQFAGSVELPDTRDPPTRKQSFSQVRFRFSTRPVATITQISGAGFGLQSHVALDPNTIPIAKLFQKNAAGRFDPTSSSLIPFRDTTPPSNLEYVGDARIEPSPTITTGVFKIDGLRNTFGATVEIDPTKHAPPISAPKSKADANYYINVLHEAGIGITPTWVADVKVSPVLGRLPGDFFWTPSFTANVGAGSVGDTKATDTIDASLGVTRLIRSSGVFEGLRVTPSFTYETDRENDKRNALFDGDLRLYFKGLSNTRAEKQLDEFLKRKATDKNLQLQDVKVGFGYSIQFFLGTEAGGALVETIAKSTDKLSQVVVPVYSIARLRPRMVTTLEWKAFTFTVSATPRYLFTGENVTRQTAVLVNGSAKQKIFLDTVSGWHPYGEVGLNIALDPAGHYALGTTYKIGYQPPNFRKADLFLNGVIIRF